MTPNEYMDRALAKEADQQEIHIWVAKQGPNATRLNNACRGLADDCGELNGAAKKWLEYQQPLDKANVIEEIGDCLWRLAQACKAVGVTMEEVMVANLRKLEEVRYKDTICNPHDAKESSRDRKLEAQKIVEAVVNVRKEIIDQANEEINQELKEMDDLRREMAEDDGVRYED